MSDEPRSTVSREFATQRIVGAYLRNHEIAPDQLPALIPTAHQALADLGRTKVEDAGERVPAVPIRRSVQRDHVVCLECGWQGETLRRHLSAAHRLSPAEDRARWKLTREHPIVAPAYAERRSTLAKALGLGRTRANSAAPGSQRRGGRKGG